MQIQSVKLTEIEIDKDTTIRVPSDMHQKLDVPIKARLVFAGADGKESGIDIAIRAWKIVGKGQFRIDILSQEG